MNNRPMTYDDFSKWLKHANPKCASCQTKLGDQEPQFYPHAHGVEMREGERVYIYVTCPTCHEKWSYMMLIRQIAREIEIENEGKEEQKIEQ